MKLEHVHIENFKGVKSFDWDLRDDSGEPRTRALLVGDNGSGKTSVLQAIALTMGLATDQVRDMESFQWFGFHKRRIATLGRPEVHLRVRFSIEEHAVAEAWFRRFSDGIGGYVPHADVALSFRSGKVTVSPEKADLLLSARALSQVADLGGVFWFDQFRSLGTQGTNGDALGDQNVPWNQGVEAVRESLSRWDNLHKSLLLKQRELKPGQRDLLAELEVAYNRLFPGTTFVGVEPYGEGAGQYYFLLKRDGVLYDIAEASSGEQAIFPLLYEIVRRSIGRSIIIIDEVELHLHPPLAQALYNLLPRLAPDCQFLVTTHSEAVAEIVPPEEITRLPGGRPCL